MPCYNTECVRCRATYIGMSPSGKAPDFDSGIRRFKSCHPSHKLRDCWSYISSVYDLLAQLAEQLPFKQWVRSSNLRQVTKNSRYPNRVSAIFIWDRRRFERLNAARTSAAGDGSTSPILHSRHRWECKRIDRRSPRKAIPQKWYGFFNTEYAGDSKNTNAPVQSLVAILVELFSGNLQQTENLQGGLLQIAVCISGI